MRDLDVRKALCPDLIEEHKYEPDTLIIEEMGLCGGTVRIDIAVINGALNGFEIKSDRDTLTRLPRQMELYNRIFDFSTLVVGSGHFEKVRSEIPEWWGILVAETCGGGEVELTTIRAAQRNPGVEKAAIVQLLWRDEALNLLARLDLDAGLKSKPRKRLWAALAEALDLDELGRLVRSTLKARKGWRAALLHTRDDDSCRRSAKSSGCQVPLLGCTG